MTYKKYTDVAGKAPPRKGGPDPDAYNTPEPIDWWSTDPSLKEPDFPKNFAKVKRYQEYILIRHKVTRERKWVSLKEINQSSIPDAFYDADPHFSPPGTSWGDS